MIKCLKLRCYYLHWMWLNEASLGFFLLPSIQDLLAWGLLLVFDFLVLPGNQDLLASCASPTHHSKGNELTISTLTCTILIIATLCWAGYCCIIVPVVSLVHNKIQSTACYVWKQSCVVLRMVLHIRSPLPLKDADTSGEVEQSSAPYIVCVAYRQSECRWQVFCQVWPYRKVVVLIVVCVSC